MPTFAYCVAGRVHVAVHSDESPSADEWSAYLADIAERLRDIDAIYSATRGGGPSSAQRTQSVEFWKTQPKTPRIAVVTPSMLVVRMAGALRWFMPSQIKAFRVSDVSAAFDYLGLRPAQRAAVEGAVRELERKLGLAGR